MPSTTFKMMKAFLREAELLQINYKICLGGGLDISSESDA